MSTFDWLNSLVRQIVEHPKRKGVHIKLIADSFQSEDVRVYINGTEITSGVANVTYTAKAGGISRVIMEFIPVGGIHFELKGNETLTQKQLEGLKQRLVSEEVANKI